MTYIREISSTAERQALAKKCYELSALGGKADPDIAVELHLELFQVTSLRKWYFENRVEQEIEETEARSKWRERTEDAYSKIVTAYEAGMISPKDFVSAYTQIAKLGIDLDALAKPRDVNINVRGSKVDQEIEKLLGAFPAKDEEDAPL